MGECRGWWCEKGCQVGEGVNSQAEGCIRLIAFVLGTELYRFKFFIDTLQIIKKSI